MLRCLAEMFPPTPGATQAEIEAAHEKHTRALRALAKKLQIPAPAADALIEEVLHSALLLKANVDIDQWLAASLTAAAKRLRERGA
jgi:hypothetical protein